MAAALGAACLGLLGALAIARRVLGRTAGYSGLRASGGGEGALMRVSFELGSGLREDGEASLENVKSIKQLRLVLLGLADELLLDPEDDLGEWTLRYTDRGGVLRPVTAAVSETSSPSFAAAP